MVTAFDCGVEGWDLRRYRRAFVASALAAYGSYKQGQAQAEANTRNAEMDYYAAQENTAQTNRAVTAAGENEQQQLGSVRAAYGASGVTMNGTASDVLASQAGIMNDKIAGILEEGTFRTEQLGREEEAAKEGASNASAMSYIGAGAAFAQGIKGDAMAAAKGGGG